MALNTDFKVKDSLYVGNSACFVTQTDTPVILSAGNSLFDVFVQQGEVGTNCTLSNGVGIATLSYDGSANTTVSVAANCNTAWNNKLDSSGTIANNDFAKFNSSGNLVGRSYTETKCDLGLNSTDSPTFAGVTINGNIGVTGTVDGRDVAADGSKLDSINTTFTATSGNYVCSGSSPSQGTVTLNQYDGTTVTIDTGLQVGDNVQFTDICGTGTLGIDGQILSGGTDLFDLFAEGDITEVVAGNGLTGGGASGCVTLNVGAGTAITVAADTIGVTAACNTAWNNAYNWCLTNGSNVYDSASSPSQGTLNLTDVGNNTDTIDLGLQRGDSPVFLGLSAITLSGDGQCITNVTAAFPTTQETNLTTGDKFYINDGSNKYVTYASLLTDLAGGTGICVQSSDSLGIVGATGLCTNYLSKWTGSGFANSIASDDGTTFTITCNAVVQGDLTVQGDFTCLDTIVSTTSALSVTNAGTGPALFVCQTGIQPIAHFIDSNGDDIVFNDNGFVGIGCATPGQKLVVAGDACITCSTDIDGNLTVDGNTTLGNAASDAVTVNACGILFNSGLPAGVDNSVLILDSDNCVKTDEIDSKVWASKLVDYNGASVTNYLTKYIDTTGTIDESTIQDSGTLVTIGSDVKVDANKSLDIYATGGTIYSSEQTFTATVGTGGTTVATFAKSGLDSAKYNVVLINGVNKTAFEIIVVYNGTNSFGTVYGIVDAQAASQLDTIDVSNTGSTIDLVITSASASTTAIIQGKALY